MINEFMFLYMLLAFKHFIADFILQTPKMVEDKGTFGAWGGIHHSLHHFIGSTLVFGWFFDPIIVLALSLADFSLHYCIDWAKMNVSRGFTAKDKIYWIYIGLDQLLHYLTYLLLIWLAFNS